MEATILYVDGLPGAGKTSLIASLKALKTAQVLVWEEKIDQTRLNLMLSNMKRYAFDYQMFRLRESARVFKEALSAALAGQFVVIDRSVAGDAAFAWNHFLSGNMTDKQWQTYLAELKELVGEMKAAEPFVKQLYIYLATTAPQALQRIHRRGRAGESSYTLKYLKSVESAHMTMYNQLNLSFAMVGSKEQSPPPSPSAPCPHLASSFLSEIGVCAQ